MAYTYSGGESMHGSGSTSAVLQLHTNDDVWIRILGDEGVNDGNIRVHGDKWSSFCGFKIA
ncbi:hypothetical protein FSP39_005986 [Pinctada imbricata]|uniref:C1q domain-containing protein n=1 Tax=Pinctada imbricata TaxID=66713 RepID=A0AA89C313_PINIB|nr:hypothetical protein FSP39_005986 [Pinctada imbricata]